MDTSLLERLKMTNFLQNYQDVDKARNCAEKQLSQYVSFIVLYYLKVYLLIPHSRLLSSRHDVICKSSNERSYFLTDSLWNLELYAAILQYAQTANKSIAARVLNLPRELRDAIYTYLWEPDGSCDPTRDLLYWWEHFDEPWIIKGIALSNSSLPSSMANLRPPHFTDQAFVSKAFAIEVLKRFQDTIGKDMRLKDNRMPIAEFSIIDSSLEAFVRKDVFGIGKTIEELVRNLDLQVDFQCDALEYDDELQPNQTKRLAVQEYLDELENGVSALLGLPYTERMILYDLHSRHVVNRPRTVTLVIRQECAVNIENNLVTVLRLVLRAYKALKTKGFTVKIRYRSEEIGLNVTLEDDVLAWTDKDWQTNLKEKNLSRVDPAEWDLERQTLVWARVRENLYNEDGDNQ